MTKEELEKEIRKYLKKTFHHEYYDDVVMVMGFAEPREKQIAELEKENKVLAQNLEDTEIVNKALEKENADLQKSYQDLYNSMRVIKDQRNKAKELLKEFKRVLKEHNLYHNDLYKRTEQFLNSEVEKCGQ